MAISGKTTLVDLEISGNPKCLALVRRILVASTNCFSLPQCFLNDIKLAVTEACTNVIKHAFKFDRNKKFGLNIQACERFFQIRVVYEDGKFKPDEIPVPDLTNIQEGGLGVFIIRNIMDEVVYTVDPGTGTVVLRMVKNLASSSENSGE